MSAEIERQSAYRDFTLKIERAGQGYAVQAQGPMGSEGRAMFALPFSGPEVENFILKMNHPRRLFGRSGRAPEPAQPTVEFGGKLYAALCCGEVRDVLVAARQEAELSGYGLRFKLRLSGAPELADLPWEFLHDGRGFLALSTQTPLVRYLDVTKPYRPLKLDLPLRMLATLSSPSDLPPLDVQGEQDKVQEALGALLKDGLIALDWQTDGTLDAFRRTLRQARRAGRPYHIWHHIGHGVYGAQGSELMFCDSSNRSLPVGGFQLGALFNDYPELRLALLNACEGARPDRQDPLNGVAAALVECGVPAVIGMQFEISDRAAIQFAEEFYAALVGGQPVDAAVSEARLAVFCLPNWVEWATPVLYMRAADGVLFEVREEGTRDKGEGIREAERKAKEEVDRKVKEEAARKAAEEQERQAKKATERQAQEERERQAREVAARKASPQSTAERKAERRIATPIIEPETSPAGPLRIDPAKCTACGDCVEVCPVEAIHREQDSFAIDPDECIECGACEAECPVGAIETAERRAGLQLAAGKGKVETRPTRQPFEPEMILIPAGPFLMGSDPKKDKDARSDEQPQHTLSLPDYWMAQTPITNAQYLAFVQNSGHRPPKHWEDGRIPQGKEEHPVVYVTWRDAVACCEWLAQATGKPYRLPTEAEWEKGARGTDGRIWPWGNEPPDKTRCNFGINVSNTTPVDAYPAGASPYGLLDMAGNVWEWTGSLYKPYPYQANDGREDPAAPGGRVVRGGSWYDDLGLARCAARLGRLNPDYSHFNSGFRCVSPISRSGS